MKTRELFRFAFVSLVALGVIAPASAATHSTRLFTAHQENIASRDVVSFAHRVHIPNAHDVRLPRPGKSASTPAGTTPSVSPGFAGPIGDGVTIPADATGAVSRDRIMTATNTEVRVSTRQGVTTFTQSLGAWWSGLGVSSVFGPRIAYDPFGSRWIFTAAADAALPTSSLLLAVSDSVDATGTWHRYRIAASPSTLRFSDAPAPGFSANWVGVQVNAYTATNAFVLSRVFAFPRADLYAGDISTVSAIDLTGAGKFQQPATTYDAGIGSLYLLQAKSNGLERYSVTGSSNAPSITDLGSVASPLPYAFTGPGAKQAGSTETIDLGDANLHSVVYRNGSLWTAHTVFLPATNPTFSSIQWWQVSASTGAVEQHGRVQCDDNFDGYPSIAVNSGSDVLLGYTRFSPSTFPSAEFSYRNGADPINTMQISKTFKAGEASYVNKDSLGVNRWGDYSAAVVDPFNDRDMWTLQEFASTPSGLLDRWGTWWSRIAPTAGAAVTLNPQSIEFGGVVVGTTSPVHSLVLTNSGNEDLVLGSAVVVGPQAPEFSVVGDSCSGATLMQGDACQLDLTFSPFAAGGRFGSLSIPSNAASSPDLVSLHGTGIIILHAPHISLEPTSIDFGDVEVGHTSEPKTLRVINDGNEPLLVGTVIIDGVNPGDFNIVTDSCSGQSVSPNNFCSVTLTFSPTKLGIRTASVAIYSNITNGLSRVNIWGNGVDLTAPVTQITTPDGSLRIGIPLSIFDPYATIEGTATDGVSGVKSLTVRFDGLLLSQTLHPSLSCNPARTSCTWSVRVPLIPGPYTVTAFAADRSNNVEHPGVTITILDV